MIISYTRILSSGKFLNRPRAATEQVGYSVGYSYHPQQAGVSLRFSNKEQQTMEMRLTPEQAEEMAKRLIEWAYKTREYQKTV